MGLVAGNWYRIYRIINSLVLEDRVYGTSLCVFYTTRYYVTPTPSVRGLNSRLVVSQLASMKRCGGVICVVNLSKNIKETFRLFFEDRSLFIANFL